MLQIFNKAYFNMTIYIVRNELTFSHTTIQRPKRKKKKKKPKLELKKQGKVIQLNT